MRTLVVIGTLAAALACGFGDAFVCEDDSQCNDGGAVGVCQSGGHCSFPDDACESGQRYGDHVGGGLAGDCVPTLDDTTGAGDDATVTSATVGDGTHGGVASSVEEASSIDVTSASTDPDTSAGPGVVDEGSSGAGEDSTGGPIDVDPDLVLWLTFDDPDTPLADSSIYARDVTCDAAASTCADVVADGAMELAGLFDGTNDALQVAHDPALETDAGLTVAVRVRNDAVSSLPIHSVIARPFDVVTDNSWELFFRDESGDGMNDVVFEIADPGGQLQLITTAPVGKGEWVRIVAVWTIDSIALYFDGVLQTNAASTGMLLDGSPMVVGADIDDLVVTNYFAGALDDVRVYRRALTDDEIAALP